MEIMRVSWSGIHTQMSCTCINCSVEYNHNYNQYQCVLVQCITAVLDSKCLIIITQCMCSEYVINIMTEW